MRPDPFLPSKSTQPPSRGGLLDLLDKGARGGTPGGEYLRARRLARAARLFAGFVRPDAVFAEAGRAPLRLLGDVVASIHVSLLRGVGPVLVINTVVVVAPAERRLVRRPVGGCRYYLGRSLARRAFDTARVLFALRVQECVVLVDVVVEAPTTLVERAERTTRDK